MALTGCQKVEEKETSIPFVAVIHDLQDLPWEDVYLLDDTKGGPVLAGALREASGLAASRVQPGVYWSHNDSGHAARLFAIGSQGEHLGILIPEGAGSRDWEDMCAGPGPELDRSYLYIADIGDNAGVNPFVVVYRFLEPDPATLHPDSLRYLPQSEVARFELRYPDGPRDAESFMVDPVSGDWFIISKRDFRSVVYRVPFPQKTGMSIQMEKRLQLPFSGAVAADISADGSRIAVKDLHTIYFWQRLRGEHVLETLQRKPTRLPYLPEPKGESFAWRVDEEGYCTVSEKGPASAPPVPLIIYKKK